MVCLLLALIFHSTIFRRVALSSDESHKPSVRHKAVALVSMTLWLGVGIGGRAIGFIWFELDGRFSNP
jgi:hypothetical protein